MATALPTRQKRPADGFAGRDPQVYHPLDVLRGTIRRYVVIEGVLSAVLFLTLWFTLGLALDYGVFKATWWDWALDGSWWLRLVALVVAVGLFGAILVLRIGRRVNKEFSYPALALVLERKFPKVLGDRLITAVEMADVDAMGKFGYSTDMIRATIAEARERVAKVPVSEVFNWRRLRRMAALTVALGVGLLAFSYASYAYMARSADPYRFAWKFAHVTGIFVERNVALLNTPWPRDAYVELVGLPEGGEIAIGRDAPPPQLTVRAYRWVIADRSSVHGWRPMLWSDVTPKLVGRAVPDLPLAALRLPAEAGDATPDGSAWTLDTVEARASEVEAEGGAESAGVRQQLRARMGDEFDQLQEVFRALAERADEPGMARTFRRLGTTRNQFKVTERDPVTKELQFVFRFDRDAEIFAEYQFSGKKTSGSGTLAKQRNNVYEGSVSGLKEDVEFIVRAADFDTAPRRIRIIPPPSLKRLIRDQAEPGYLHHAPPLNEGYNALEGQLQKVAAKDLSLTGDRSVVVVPSGTVLTLTGEAYTADDGSIPESDRIVRAEATPVSGRFPGTVYDDKAKPTQAPVPLAITGDGAAFSVTFNETVPLPRRVAGGTDFAGNAFAAAVGAVRRYTDFRLTENVEFKVEFTNKYNVKTTRTFVIQVVQDQAPVVEFAVDVIRKSGNFYLVTPKARIPFEPNSFVKDDRGLSKLVYTFSYYSEDSDFVRGLRTKFALRSLLDVPMPGSLAGALPLRHADNFRLLDKSDDRQYPSALVSDFDNQQGTLLRDNRDDLAALLATPRGEELTPQLLKLLDEKYPGRAPGSKAFWVGGPQAVRAFWVGEPYTAKAVWVADAADPQSYNKIDLKSTERGAFRRELIDRKAISEGDEFHWFGEAQTVKRVELKNPDRDYFDLKEMHDRGALKIAAKDTEVQTIYRMDLNIEATDTNVDNEGGPRVTRNGEVIRLRIVSEGDLLIEISREEEQLGTRLDEALLKLAAAKRKYEFVRSTNGYKDETPEQVDAVKVRGQDAAGDVEKARDVVQAVAREYRRLTRECAINRLNEAAQTRYAAITAEIDQIVSDSPQVPVTTFPKTQALLLGVQNTLNGGRWAPLAAVSDAENSLYALERDLRILRDKIDKSQNLDGLKKSVVAIQERQRRIAAEVEKMRAKAEGILSKKEPDIGEAGAVSLTKGESKKIQHVIEWRQYLGPKGKEDELQVKVTASDPSIMVPAEMTLNYEKHERRFEYEIKAGTKEGTFKITVTPAVGKPVEVQVTVK